MRRVRHISFGIPYFSLLVPVLSITWGSSPEASSTLLQLHRLYLQQPPHDRSLYDRLHVSPNATAAAIRKNYRKLSREYHPDKQQRYSSSFHQQQSHQERLQQIRQAYEILKDDRSRLPYHRYGLLDMRQAVILLTGQHYSEGAQDPSIAALLQLMGYPMHHHDQIPPIPSHDGMTWDYAAYNPPLPTSKHDRIWLIAVSLVERMRPFVEGRIGAQALADHVAADCDNLKRLPLGASILRCIGRAYRYEGSRYLRTHRRRHSNSRGSPSQTTELLADVTETVRYHWRNAKHLATAAVASGRCVIAEQHHKLGMKQDAAQSEMMCHYDDGDIGQLADEEALPSEEELRLREKLKAQRVMIESLQIEALWKVSKMELDQIIRDACQLILSGEYLFFFPSYQSPLYHAAAESHHWYQQSDGWVGSAGIAIDANLGRFRAAQALTIMGEVMVSRSKEDTAWMQ